MEVWDPGCAGEVSRTSSGGIAGFGWIQWGLARDKAEGGSANEKLKSYAFKFRAVFSGQWGAITAL